MSDRFVQPGDSRKGDWRGATRRVGPACVSDLALDQLTLGELDQSAREQVLAHLGGCPSCAEARRGRQAEAEAFHAGVDIPALAARTLAQADQTAVSSRWPWFPRKLSTMALPAGAAVAAAVLLLAPWRPQQSATEVGTRTKGAFSLTTFVQHAEAQGPATLYLGEALHPGDRLQFRYSGSAAHLIVLAVDAAGRVSVFYPPGSHAAPVAAGRDVALSTAVQLDDSVGPETVVALRCEQAVAVAEAQAAASRAVAVAGRRGENLDAVGGLGLPCAEFRQRLVKQPPGGKDDVGSTR